ncbi:MAG: YabP/YqfC family sporulation protein [Candidatus Pelethousia sp.]|nr:YabP/YqfC family sporulation protein [Candidatus Pelethousia sp.]
MQKNKRRIRLGRRLLSALDLPEEAAGTPKLTVLGREHALIENHTGIYQYRAQEICLSTKAGMLHITGEALTLLEITPERLYISGRVDSLRYEEGLGTKVNKM